MINLFFLINRQGKIRLTKFFDTFNISERNKLLREVRLYSLYIIKYIFKKLDRCCCNIQIIKNE